ncbi:MAG: DNA polymerase IV [Candidatus Coatesbacteria bacterium]|nr:MAG: DNA polymerase IV [Candidatus Coatesbacteria bacterium]
MWGSTTGLATRQSLLGGKRPGASAFPGVDIAGERWERVVLHIDMDQFFCAVERRVNPALTGKPLVVTGSRKKRSVVAAASYESREFGVKAGMPVGEAKRRCRGLITVPADIHRYTHALRKVVVIASRFTPVVEISSIDELALDATETCKRYGSPDELAAQLKEAIRIELGLSCSIGVAENKLLAKYAAGTEKPDGLSMLRPSETSDRLENLPTTDMPGVGEKVGEYLAELGARTCGELGRLPVNRLKARFGVVGESLRMLGRGIDRRPVVPFWSDEEVKSVGNSLTVPRDVRKPKEIGRVLLWLSERVGRRLRSDGYVGRRVTCAVRYPDFYTVARSHAQKRFVDDGGDIYRCAAMLLPKDVTEKGIRMLAVSVSMLARGARPSHLFENKRDKLTEAIDRLNELYGRDCLVRAALLPDLPGAPLYREHFG